MTLSEAHAAVFCPRPDELDPFAGLRLERRIKHGPRMIDAERGIWAPDESTVVTLDAAGNVVLETPETGEDAK